LILAIERSSLPVFVVFFAISGASIDIQALERSWLLALIGINQIIGPILLQGFLYAVDEVGKKK